jgi:hypothetical protein
MADKKFGAHILHTRIEGVVVMLAGDAGAAADTVSLFF